MHFTNKTVLEKRSDFIKKLQSKKLLRFPGAYNPLCAKLIAEIGFDGVYISGGVMSNDLGLPDIGLTTLDQVSYRSEQIARVTDLPTIVDIDTGFGNCKKTIEEFENKGLAGCHLEDQIPEKRCGHLDNKELVTKEKMVEKIKESVKARKDKNVRAIVLRINSPGGSALASDVIWRETILAKDEKPLVVSMGDYAASGGYYIACAADSIVANPTTLTGSIGVFGIIPNLSEFYKNKLGITIDTVNTSKYADMGTNRPLSSFEKNKLQKSVSDMYTGFITKVGEGRNMSTAEVNEIGQGRVWTGYDAKEIGLIDTYGGLEKAIDIAAYLAKVEDYRIISLPKKKNPLEDFSLKLSGGEASISDLILSKFNFTTQITQPIEELIKGDRIQARVPFIMELK